MPRPIDPSDLDQAVALYLAGKSIQEIETDTGVTNTSLFRERKVRGIPPRPRSAVVPRTEAIDLYKSGASVLELSNRYGVSRYTITEILRQAGVERRGQSRAAKVSAQRSTAEERKTRAAAANRAARMRKVPQIQKLRHALQVESRAAHDSGGEESLNLLLRSKGVRPIPQRAVGVYNVDLAMLPVAVEVLGGGWHAVKSVHAERTPYILDEGWHLVMVWDFEGRSALDAGAADYLVAFLEEVRRNPPSTCQYRVITGQGEVLAARGREDNEFPLVPPPRGRGDIRARY